MENNKLVGRNRGMAIIKEENGCFVREHGGEKLYIQPWGENSLRIRATKNCDLDLKDWALLPQEATDCKIEIDGSQAVVTNGKIKVIVSQCGKLYFYNQKEELLLEEYQRVLGAAGEQSSALNIRARDLHPILGGDYSLTMRFESNRNEKLFGMGQYQNNIFDLKGTSLELAQRNSQASVPFVLSSCGYGFLWNNPAVGRATFATNITEWFAYSTRQIDYWITVGDTPKEILHQYGKSTGFPPVMPEYALGFWQSKLRYRTQEELLSVAREYKRLRVPLSVIVLDYFHWTNQGNWEFDPEYFPNPNAMVEELKEMGIKLMVSVWPSVDSKSKNFEEMYDKGYLIRTDRGVDTQFIFKGNISFFDTTNPDARDYVWKKIKENYFDKGIELFWLDVAEPEYSTYDFDLYRYHIGNGLQVANIYPAMYAKGFYENLKKNGVENPIELIRCAWAGSQRYGALVWSGDIDSTFESMKIQMLAGLHMAVSGISWWTTDIGGFHGGNPDDPAFRELIVRWFQYGTFCPVMRIHGDRKPTISPVTDKVGGGMCESGAPNEIWSFGEEVFRIMKKYIFLRENLKEYISHQMTIAHKTGIPPMRPLFLQYPEDSYTWDNWYEYFLGSDLLVCPVVEAGAKQRMVYLPKGDTWIDVKTGKYLDGGQSVMVDAPLDWIPLFIRENGELSMELFAKIKWL